MTKIHVLVADDHNILRQGLVDVLRNYEDIVVVAEAENGPELVIKYEKHKPDVVLTDIEMPEGSGIEAAVEIRRNNPDAKILFLSMFFSEDYILKVDSIGAKGLLSKEIYKDELVSAIRIVYQGGTYYFGMKEEEIENIRTKSKEMIDKWKNKNTLLTPREHDILLELSKGISSEEIAVNLNIAKRTVDTYRSSIMNKLKIDSLPKLVKYSIQYEENFKKK